MDLFLCLAEELREMVFFRCSAYALIRLSGTCKYWKENIWRYIRCFDAYSFDKIVQYLTRENLDFLFENNDTAPSLSEKKKNIENMFKTLHKNSRIQQLIIHYKEDFNQEKQTLTSIIQNTAYTFKNLTHLELIYFDEYARVLQHKLLTCPMPLLSKLVLDHCSIPEYVYNANGIFKSSLQELILRNSTLESMPKSKASMYLSPNITGVVTKLQRLDLIDIVETDYSGLSKLINLTRLSLKDNTYLCEEQFTTISKLTNLKELDLTGTDLDATKISLHKDLKIIQQYRYELQL